MFRKYRLTGSTYPHTFVKILVNTNTTKIKLPSNRPGTNAVGDGEVWRIVRENTTALRKIIGNSNNVKTSGTCRIKGGKPMTTDGVLTVSGN